MSFQLSLPTAIWRENDYLYIHGSNGSRLLRALKEGIAACVSITLMDGLVLARSAVAHSMNYRSVCVYGTFAPVAEFFRALATQALAIRTSTQRPGISGCDGFTDTAHGSGVKIVARAGH